MGNIIFRKKSINTLGRPIWLMDDLSTLKNTLESLWKMDEKTFLEVIQPRFWYIGQDGLWIWKYNDLRAMANSGDEGYYKYIKEAVKNPDHKIRDMALWACQKLGIQYEM